MKDVAKSRYVVAKFSVGFIFIYGVDISFLKLCVLAVGTADHITEMLNINRTRVAGTRSAFKRF
jgi:hypothetical protein